MATLRGRIPTLFENATLRAWWVAGAWEQLAPAVYSIVTHRLPRALDLDTREEVAQRTAIRCWQSQTIPDTPINFISTVARNLAKDHYKSIRTRKNIPWDDAYAPQVEATPDALAQILADRPEVRLRDALRQLPRHLQRPLILQVYHRRTAAMLAAQFGTTEGAMKMRLSRARTVLRQAYHATQLSTPQTRTPEPQSRPAPARVSVVPPHRDSVREALTRCYP